jgi:hypothetical protein
VAQYAVNIHTHTHTCIHINRQMHTDTYIFGCAGQRMRLTASRWDTATEYVDALGHEMERSVAAAVPVPAPVPEVLSVPVPAPVPDVPSAPVAADTEAAGSADPGPSAPS